MILFCNFHHIKLLSLTQTCSDLMMKQSALVACTSTLTITLQAHLCLHRLLTVPSCDIIKIDVNKINKPQKNVLV